MSNPRYYAVKAYGFPGHPFPKFWDSYKTLKQARAAARSAQADGWQYLEIMRDDVRQADSWGFGRSIVETIVPA